MQKLYEGFGFADTLEAEARLLDAEHILPK